MASSTTKYLAKRLSTIADAWVQDIFRPHLQIQTFLKSLAQHPRLAPRTVEAARAIKDNEMKKKYPLPESLARPASMPLHYVRLVDAFEKSAQGIKRPWWKVFLGKY